MPVGMLLPAGEDYGAQKIPRATEPGAGCSGENKANQRVPD